MSDILVFAFLVSCGESLMHCEDINKRHLAFGDPNACRTALSQMVSRQQRLEGSGRVVMGQCRYRLVEREDEVVVDDLRIAATVD